MFKRRYIFSVVFFHCHVSFRGCTIPSDVGDFKKHSEDPIDFVDGPSLGLLVLSAVRENTMSYLADHPRTCKWLVTPIYKPFRPFGKGTTRSLADLLTMVINHFLNGMILQVLYLAPRPQAKKGENGGFKV